MPDNIETFRVQRYTSGIMMLAQQKLSRLRNRVRVESGIKEKTTYWDQVGTAEMIDKVGRHTPTPNLEVQQERRALSLIFSHTGTLVGESDVLTILNNPTGSFGMAQAMAAARLIDRRIIEAAFADARTGEDGTGTGTWPEATHRVDSLGPLVVGSLTAAKQRIDEDEVDRTQQRHAIVRSQQITDLLDTTEVTSADFNTVKALVQGDIDTFVGFQFEQTEIIEQDPVVATTLWGLFYAQNQLLLGIGQDAKARVTERPDLDYDTQVYLSLRVGSTRMEEKGVVKVTSTF